MTRLCLIFDLDDTLYAERDFAMSAFGEIGGWAATTLGVTGFERDLTALLDDGHLGGLFGMALAARLPCHTPDDLVAVHRLYRGHTPAHLPLFDDASRALDAFGALTEVKLGLITDGTAAVQAAKIKALGIGPRFAHTVLTGSLTESRDRKDSKVRSFAKPHPLAFAQMQAALAAPGDRLVYVGDNPAKDFQAPNKLGWTTIQIDRPAARATRIHRGAQALPDGHAHHVIPSLDALANLLT
jgi:putative hydrolase of the HAD superfamily